MMLPGDTATTLCQRTAEFTRTAYRKQGFLGPQVVLTTEVDEMLFFLAGGPDRHPTDVAAHLVGIAGKVRPFRFIQFMCEAWIKEHTGDEDRNHGRGYLESIADTDPTVRTSLICFVYDVKNPELSHSIFSTTDESALPEVGFTVHENAGCDNGYLPESIHWAYQEAPAPPETIADMSAPEVLKTMASVLGMFGLITAAAYAGVGGQE